MSPMHCPTNFRAGGLALARWKEDHIRHKIRAGSQAKEAEYFSTCIPIADRPCGPPINELASSTEKQENQDSL